MYLPLAAVIAAIVVGGFVLGSNLLVARPQTRKMLGCAVSLALVWPLAILTIQRNHTYNSAWTIWEDTVRQRPGNSRAHYNLATALEEAVQIDEAIGHYEQALRLNPDFAEAHYNL